MTRGLVQLTLLAILVGFIPACSTVGEAGHVLDIELLDGGTVRQLLSPSEPAVLLMYSPAQCFACASTLGRWVQYGRDHDVGIRLVLTEKPTLNAMRTLRRFRVDVGGVVAPGTTLADSASAYLFDGITMVDNAIGVASQVALLREISG